MKKIYLLILSLAFIQNISAQNPDFTGFVRNYSGMLLGNGSTDFVILQNTFNLNIEKRYDNSFFKVNPMLYHYFADSLYFRLRESYIDLYFDNFDIRTGKQQIVWGKADGVFITDIVSPKDLFEFLLPDFDEIRRGVIGLKFDYYIDNSTLEFVWLPVFTPTKLPDENSVWAVEPNFPLPPTFDYSKQDVQASLENSEVFIKYSTLSEYIDYEIMSGYTWDDDPTMFTSVTIDSSTGTTNLIITPEHKRLPVAGGSFSAPVGPVVLRGEGAYYWGKYFNTINPALNNGVIQKDYIHYMLGIDFTLFDINLSTQFIQRVIMNYEDIIQPTVLFKGEVNNMMTFLANYSMLNETLTLEIFSYYDFEYSDALIKPRILYDYSDSINLQFGANIFTGTEGLFGQYNKNDMIYGKIIYSF